MVIANDVANEYERDMIYYAKYKSRLGSDYLKLVLCLFCVPLLTMLVFFASLAVGVGTWFLWLSDVIKVFIGK